MGFVLNRDSRGSFGEKKKKKKKTRQGIFVFLPARAPQHSLTSAKKEEKRLLYVFFPHPESQVRDVARVLMRECVRVLWQDGNTARFPSCPPLSITAGTNENRHLYSPYGTKNICHLRIWMVASYFCQAFTIFVPKGYRGTEKHK